MTTKTTQPYQSIVRHASIHTSLQWQVWNAMKRCLSLYASTCMLTLCCALCCTAPTVQYLYPPRPEHYGVATQIARTDVRQGVGPRVWGKQACPARGYMNGLVDPPLPPVGLWGVDLPTFFSSDELESPLCICDMW